MGTEGKRVSKAGEIVLFVFGLLLDFALRVSGSEAASWAPDFGLVGFMFSTDPIFMSISTLMVVMGFAWILVMLQQARLISLGLSFFSGFFMASNAMLGAILLASSIITVLLRGKTSILD